MQRTVLLALTLGLLTASPALAADLFKTETVPVVPAAGHDKTEAQEGLGVLAPLGCSLGNGQTELTDGVAVTGSLTTATGANCEFVFTPSGATNTAKFVMAPATSDFDLYVRKGALPTTSLYDCRPFAGGTAQESCLSTVLDLTPIYVMVRRFGGSGDFTVTASNIDLNPACPAGNNALALGGSASHSTPVALGAACYYQVTPGADEDLVRLTASPEGAAYGLYVKRGAVPTTSSFDCSATSSFAVRTCEVVNTGQDVFVMVRRSSSTGLGQFTVEASGVVLPALTPGVAIQAQVANFAYQYYKVVVPAGSHFVGIALTGASPTTTCNVLAFANEGPVCPGLATDYNAACGEAATAAGQPVCPAFPGSTNADLYVGHVSKGRLPTTLTSSFDCRSVAKGTNDACLFSTEAAGALAQAGQPSELGTTREFGAGPVNVKPYTTDGKYLVGVRGNSSPSAPADYVLTALYG